MYDDIYEAIDSNDSKHSGPRSLPDDEEEDQEIID